LVEERPAISKVQTIIAVVLVAVAAGVVGGYILSSANPQSGPGVIDLSIVETDQINQVDSFMPANVTVTHGTRVTLAVQNGDDQARTFEISALGINQTISSGTADRITFTPSQTGVFEMFVPSTPASAANGKASPSITGYLIVN
jgi:plastocyanin